MRWLSFTRPYQPAGNRNTRHADLDNLMLDRRYHGEHPLGTLLYLFRGDYGHLVLSIVFYAIKHSPVWLMPLITASVIDVVTRPDIHPLSDLLFWMPLLVLIIVQNIPTHWLFMRSLSISIRNMELRLRSALSRRLQQLTMSFYHRSSIGALQTKLLRDVEVIQNLTNLLFQNVPSGIITLLFAIGVTAVRAPYFLLFYLLTVPATVTLMRLSMSRMARRNRNYREKLEGLSSSLVEMIHLIPVTRAHGIEAEEIARVEQKMVGVRYAGLRLDSINAIFGASSWVVFRMFEATCLGLAAYAAYTQIIPITVGDVVLLTGFFTNLINAINMMINMLPEITRGFESVYSIGEVLQSPDLELNEGKDPVKAVQGHFRFEWVGFSYPGTQDSSLREINLEVHPGETVAIVGASGAGKSTLLNLVIGFLRPTVGRILLDGKDMNTLDLRTYRRFLSVVPQETILFEGTVRENILYGVQGVDEGRLLKAIEDANAREFIDKMPQGLDTRIGENGARLSGGQRQRIAIARALIRDPRVLILDEATSALDTASERLIQDALGRLMQNRTTFVVAHRLSTIQNADRVVVLEKGHMVEVGTHSELLSLNGAYARLTRAQAG